VTDDFDSAAGRVPDAAAAAAAAEAGQTDQTTRPGASGRLIVIPLLVVMALVTAALGVAWLVTPTPDPARIIRDLSGDRRGNWRQALVLANLLRNPEYAHLRRDDGLARQLAALLEAELDGASMAPDDIRLRCFLCRAAGEFSTPVVLPVLIRAGQTQRDPAELAVQRAAVQAATVLVSRLGPETVRDHRPLLEMALAASRTFASGGDAARRASTDLRGSAAFLLGVLGSEPALDRLAMLLEDPAPDVRFNAATGLARYGRTESIPVLQEMLDPQYAEAVAAESTAQGRQWKQALVLTNAMRAVERLAEQVPAAELQPLIRSLDRLARADVPPPVQLQARQQVQALTALPAD
jgi:hypothetical protein